MWSRQLRNAIITWDELNWFMYPFGRQPLTITLVCRTEVHCYERTHAASGKYFSNPLAKGDIESDPTMYLDTDTFQRTSDSLERDAVSVSGANESSQYAAHRHLDQDELNSAHNVTRLELSISFILERDSDLQVFRLIIPTILTMLLGVFVFFVEDSTWTVDMAFAVLLVLTVIAVEVKDDFPGHVTYRSWME